MFPVVAFRVELLCVFFCVVCVSLLCVCVVVFLWFECGVCKQSMCAQLSLQVLCALCVYYVVVLGSGCCVCSVIVCCVSCVVVCLCVCFGGEGACVLLVSSVYFLCVCFPVF